MRELSEETRRRHLTSMADAELDLLVVGGGITGAGVALDAVSRGLSVGLVERDDFASGTSGRSSRLVHGGLRYLRQGDPWLVRESLRERDLLRRLAPHLVRPLPFFLPTRRLSVRAAMWTGLTVYDLLSVGGRMPWHRRVGPKEGARLAPALSFRAGGHVLWDCRTDDARLTVEVLRQAAARGALVANHAEVRSILGEGRVRGAAVSDRASGETLEVRARVVVNAAGTWADRVLGLAVAGPPRLRPSKGVHLVFDRRRVPVTAGVMVPALTGRGAFVFLVPWGPRVYAGTTDTPFRGDLSDPPVEEEDAALILGAVERAVRAGLTRGDVVASWAGVRPLLDVGRGSTRDLSRRHVVFEDPPGLVTVTGGKLTTYRAMAEETVDLACRSLGRGGSSGTKGIPLGLTGPAEAAVDGALREAVRLDHHPDLGRRMVARYGDDWPAAMGMIAEEPSLGDEVVPGLPVRAVELRMARIREMALTDRDVLERRTRLTTMDARAAERLAGRSAG